MTRAALLVTHGSRRVRVVIVCCSIFLLLLLTQACSNYWGRRPIDQPVPVQRDVPVWIWSSSGVEKWHAVVITQDHVSGIPYQKSLHCDSCWRSIPRAQVDSMKIGYHTFVEGVSHVGAGTLIVLGVTFAFCSMVSIWSSKCLD